MTLKTLRGGLLGLAVTTLLWISSASAPAVRDLGSRLELFLDQQLIASSSRIQVTLHSPQRREKVLTIDQAWEKSWQEMPEAQRREEIARGVWNGPTPFGFTTIFKDGDLYRFYYTWDLHRRESITAYAESRDGIHWHKPALNLIELGGSKANNLIWSEEGIHNFNPFRDSNPAAPASERYKALGGGHQKGPSGLIAFASEDGLHWRKLKETPVITDGAFDSQNIAFWDEGLQQYVAYYRDFVPHEGKKHGIRAIKRATSSDFLHWSPGQWLDYGEAPLEQFYTNSIVPYFRAPHFHIGFPMRLVTDRKKMAEHPYQGVSDAVLISSRDGLRWDRSFMGGYINPGLDIRNWTERNFLVTWGIVPTGPEEISLYWVENFRHPSIHVRRGTLRTDGFTSLYGDFTGGEFTTHPFTFQGRRLFLNYSTSAPGSLRIELQSAEGAPIPGFSLAEAGELFGDSIREEYRWESGEDLSRWQGRPVRMRVLLKDAHLYSFQFSP